MAINKNQIKQWIQQYADNCGIPEVADSLGSNGTTWSQQSGQPNLSEGMLAICDGIADGVNQESQRLENLITELAGQVMQFKEKINETIWMVNWLDPRVAGNIGVTGPWRWKEQVPIFHTTGGFVGSGPFDGGYVEKLD